MENRILCVILNNKLRLFASLFDFINNIEDVVKINSMDIIKLNNELQIQNKKIEIFVEVNGKIETMYLKYVNVIKGWDIETIDIENNILEL